MNYHLKQHINKCNMFITSNISMNIHQTIYIKNYLLNFTKQTNYSINLLLLARSSPDRKGAVCLLKEGTVS